MAPEIRAPASIPEPPVGPESEAPSPGYYSKSIGETGRVLAVDLVRSRRGASSGVGPSELVEPRGSEILEGHRGPDFDLRIEGQEPRLRDGRQRRGVGEIESDERRSLTVASGEVDRLGLQLGENALELLARGAVPDSLPE